jgi:2-dehydropantoate 2-reductase
VTISPNRFDTLQEYMTNLPGTTRSSLLIDLEQGKRIEVEALQGAAVRRAKKHNVSVPIVSTLYALLKPWENGPVK